MRKVTVHDKMQTQYEYVCSEPIGKNFDPEIKPMLTPKEMLELGVFGGVYMRDCTNEFPKNWFTHAKFAKGLPDSQLNYFQIHASQPLSVWREKGGYTQMIREDGFSGIVATTWGDGYPMRTKDRYVDGKLFLGT